MIEHACSECGHQLASKDKMAGQHVTCPECEARVKVPESEEESALGPAKKPTAEQGESDGTGEAAGRKRSDNTAKGKAIYKDLPRELPDGVEKLGDPISLYKFDSTPGTKLAFLLIGIGFLLIGVAFIVAIVLGKVGLDTLIWVVLAAIIGVVLIVLSRTDIYRRVVVFEEGLLEIDGKQSFVIPWKKIKEIYQKVTENYVNGFHAYTSHKYTVRFGKDLERVYNDSLPNVEKLGESIQCEVTRVLLPRLLDACNQGEKVEFGPFVVDQAGLTYNKSSLEWGQIEAVKLNKGEFVIRKKGKWLSWGKVAVPEVPNVMVFLAIVDKILGVESDPYSSKNFS